METDELLRGMQLRRKVILIIAGVMVLLVIARFCFNMAAYLSFEKDLNGYAVVEVVEVERETFSEGGIG